MNNTDILVTTLFNYPESCFLCRSALFSGYADTLKLHVHDHFSIMMIKSGSVRHHRGDEVIDLKRGDMYIIPPYIVHHEEYLEKGTQLYNISFTKEFLQYDPKGETIKDRLISFLLMDSVLGKSEKTKQKVVLNADDQTFMIRYVEQFHYEFKKRREGMFELLNSILMTIINMFGWKYLYQPNIMHNELKYRRINKVVQGAIEYMHNNFYKKITIDDVLMEVGASRTTFCTVFKDVTGTTFHTYLNNLRCEKAAQLLVEQDHSLDVIAEMTGFGDAAGFYRNFVKCYGMSPGKYRGENEK